MPEKIIYEQGTTYKLTGSYDINAESIQIINAPVSGFPMWVPAGFPPVRWDSIKVIEASNPVITYEAFKEQKPEVALNIESLSDEDKKSLVENFDISYLTEPLKSVENQIFIYLILAIILLYLWKK